MPIRMTICMSVRIFNYAQLPSECENGDGFNETLTSASECETPCVVDALEQTTMPIATNLPVLDPKNALAM